MIAIIDYGMGNLRSVQKGFEKVGHRAVVTSEPKTIAEASHVVLPGVGAFRDCMRNLEERGLIDTVGRAVNEGKPFLGICLGLQLLFSESEEFGMHKGLDIIKGKVVRFNVGAYRNTPLQPLKVPHMGWNTVKIRKNTHCLNGIEDESHFYFVHSYYVVPEEEGIVATVTNYGVDFVSSIAKDNIFACQFHPEKSQENGLKILGNFGKMKG